MFQTSLEILLMVVASWLYARHLIKKSRKKEALARKHASLSKAANQIELLTENGQLANLQWTNYIRWYPAKQIIKFSLSWPFGICMLPPANLLPRTLQVTFIQTAADFQYFAACMVGKHGFEISNFEEWYEKDYHRITISPAKKTKLVVKEEPKTGEGSLSLSDGEGKLSIALSEEGRLSKTEK